MRPLPTFNPRSTELLNNVDLAQRFWQTSEEEILVEDWKKFCQWLQLELRTLAPSLRGWSTPWIAPGDGCESVNIEANASWTHNGERAVCLGFTVFPDYFDDYSHPNVGLWVNSEWPHHDAFYAFIAQHCPDRFVSTDSDANPDPEYPFWRDLPLGKYRSNGTFDRDGFARAIGQAFESLAAVRPIVDRFLGELKARPTVAPVGKALILDIEGFEEVVEVGLILAAYNSQTGELSGVLDTYTGLRDPGAGAKLPAKITSKMIKGKNWTVPRLKISSPKLMSSFRTTTGSINLNSRHCSLPARNRNGSVR